LKIVGAIVHQLVQGASVKEIKAAGLDAYYADQIKQYIQ
jgi:hypothetical protein